MLPAEFPGQDARPGRRADGRGAKRVGKANPALCQSVDMGSLDDLVSHATQQVPAMVVGHQENDVWRPLRGLTARACSCSAARRRQTEKPSAIKGVTDRHQVSLPAPSTIPPAARSGFGRCIPLEPAGAITREEASTVKVTPSASQAQAAGGSTPGRPRPRSVQARSDRPQPVYRALLHVPRP